jgi:hypothetical protein
MFEDPLCSLFKSLGIHGMDAARPRGRECFTPGNFITDTTVRPSHGRPSGHRPTVHPSAIVRVTTLLRISSLQELVGTQ